MREIDVALARQHMGTALADWVLFPKMLHQVRLDSWLFLSGSPFTGFNKAMVNTNDEETLSKILRIIGEEAVPTHLFLAADARNLANRLPTGWKRVGKDPFMFKCLDVTDQEFDPRVSVADIDDYETVITLLSDSFEAEPTRDPIIANMLKNPLAVNDIWVLKEDGKAVCTVMTCPVGDALTVWAMSTPPQFRRMGYAKALLGDVLRRSALNGARTGLLVATDLGKRLYDAMGWTTLEEWDVYTNGVAIQ